VNFEQLSFFFLTIGSTKKEIHIRITKNLTYSIIAVTWIRIKTN